MIASMTGAQLNDFCLLLADPEKYAAEKTTVNTNNRFKFNIITFRFPSLKTDITSVCEFLYSGLEHPYIRGMCVQNVETLHDN